VTGASSGIGRGTALKLAGEGCTVTITGRNNDNLVQLTENLKKLGLTADQILSICGDICDSTFRERVVNETVAKFGKLDILVNNAGILYCASCEESDMSEYDQIFDVNVKAPFHLTKLAIPHLRKTKGNIVNVSSVNGIRSYAGVTAYNMTKAALDQMTKTVALEVAADGIRVNSINPGVIITEIHKRGGLSEEGYQEFLKTCARTHPLGRPGQVDEATSCVAFLASDDASYCTGNLLSVDGGRGVLGLRK